MTKNCDIKILEKLKNVEILMNRYEVEIIKLNEQTKTLFDLWNSYNILKNVMLVVSIFSAFSLLIWNLKLIGII
jgi:hypothetical protein